MPLGGLIPYSEEENEVPPVFGEFGDLNDEQVLDADGDLTLDDMQLMEALGLPFPAKRKARAAMDESEGGLDLARAISGEEGF